jgi:VPS62-like protein
MLVVAAAAAAAPTNAEQTLAEQYAPVLRLPESHTCGEGRPIEPIDVNLILGNPDVALRGPWDKTNVVKIGPVAADLAKGLYGYHLDFPGSALRPGCTYDLWARRIEAGEPPTTYARVVTDPGHPGELALQYWFFYVFNNFNDKHEGDWEMIQLDFAAHDAAEALRSAPTFVGYSQHEGAERASWGDSKLERVDGSHPVVYPARGSNANYFHRGLFLGKSATQGVGCDDVHERTVELRPVVRVIPTGDAAAVREYPWLAYRGRWGEQHQRFYDGPSGPITKTQWAAPFTWAATDWRASSYAVPTGYSLGAATGFFCGSVAAGSTLLTTLVYSPSPLLIALAALIALLTWLGSRTSWRPSAPLHLERRRSWGSIVSASRRMYVAHPRTFLGIGLLFIPLGALISLVQYLLFKESGFDALVSVAGRTNAFVDSVAVALGLLITLFGLAVVQSATTLAMVDADAGRKTNVLSAYRRTLPRLLSLLAVVLIPATVVSFVDLTLIGVVLATFLIVRWSLAAQVVILENVRAPAAIFRSGRLVAGHWWRTASLLLFVTGLALLAGPVVGTLLLFVTSASVDLINLISGVVYAVLLPFVAIATTYLYFDLRLEHATDEEADDVLPAETTS